MMAGDHKKFYRVQHAKIYLLDLKVQYKHKMKLSLAMVSKHVFLYLCLPDYNVMPNMVEQIYKREQYFHIFIKIQPSHYKHLVACLSLAL